MSAGVSSSFCWRSLPQRATELCKHSPAVQFPRPWLLHSSKRCHTGRDHLCLRHDRLEEPHNCPRGVRCHAKRKRSERSDPLVELYGLTKTHDGEKLLFSDLSLTVNPGDKISLVGANGTGKSTLLRVIQGIDGVDEGKVYRRKGLSVGYCPQEPLLNDSLTAVQTVLASESSAAQAARLYASTAQEAADGSASQSLDEATADMDALGAWELDERAREMLALAGIPDADAPVRNMSGGQRRKVALAAALLAHPQLLILDEPTNHLDMATITWLEQELADADISLIMVTHDRWFMESVCTRLVELDQGSAHVHSFGGPGSYALYREAREDRRQAEANAASAARNQLRKESVWMSKQPKARATKAAARVTRFYELTAAAAAGPKDDAAVDLAGSGTARRQGSKVLVMAGATADIAGKEVVSNFHYEFQPRERLGLVGPNGSGKTTLMRMLADQLPLVGGTRELGETTAVGYLSQQMSAVSADISALQYIREITDDASDGPILEGADKPENLLERLGFPRPRQLQPVRTLSGGELRRLQLGAVLAARPTLLLLDEPTNDLDVMTVERLEALLKSWRGCLVLASHDRALLDAVAPRLLVLQGDGPVRLFDGSYSQYGEYEAERQAAKQQAEAEAAAASKVKLRAAQNPPKQQLASKAIAPKRVLKLGYREQQEYSKLEGEIEALSKQQSQLDDRLNAMSHSGSHHLDLSEISKQLAEVCNKLDLKTERWLELADIAEAAGQAA